MFYVYELIDPRDDRVFYVGKGKNRRCYEHIKEAKRGKVGLKCDLIRDILASGYEVNVMVIRNFQDEDKAYAFEKKRIAKYGLENLTNVSAGGREMTSAQFYARREARRLCASMARMCHVLRKYQQTGFRFCGRFWDVPRDVAESIKNKGIRHVLETLGESEAKAEFLKYGVVLENKA